MDPTGQGVLSYLEFYNCCYDIQDICHNTIDPIDQLLQMTKQNLQLSKLDNPRETIQWLME